LRPRDSVNLLFNWLTLMTKPDEDMMRSIEQIFCIIFKKKIYYLTARLCYAALFTRALDG